MSLLLVVPIAVKQETNAHLPSAPVASAVFKCAAFCYMHAHSASTLRISCTEPDVYHKSAKWMLALDVV